MVFCSCLFNFSLLNVFQTAHKMEDGIVGLNFENVQSNELFEPMDQSEFSLPEIDQSESSFCSDKADNSDTDDEEKETFYFESDHVALKGNRDYQMLLRTIALLETQRIQVKCIQNDGFLRNGCFV